VGGLHANEAALPAHWAAAAGARVFPQGKSSTDSFAKSELRARGKSSSTFSKIPLAFHLPRGKTKVLEKGQQDGALGFMTMQATLLSLHARLHTQTIATATPPAQRPVGWWLFRC
jgi:hypothetical protein